MSTSRSPSTFVFATLACTGLAACEPPTDPSGDDPSPATEAIVRPAIYGTDDRRDYHGFPDALSRQYANGTAVLMADRWLSAVDWTGEREIDTRFYLDVESGACTDVKFRGQPFATGAQCTAFMVSPTLLATAKHCYADLAATAGVRVVFGFRSESPGTYRTRVPASNVYSIVEHIPVRSNDTLLLRLDRPVSFTRIMPTRRVGIPAEFTPVYALSYPDRIPLKHSGVAAVLDAVSFHNFDTFLDVFHGSSGGPVINQITGLVEGVVSGGPPDFVFDEANLCNRYAVYQGNEIDNETSAGAVAFVEYLPKQNRIAAGSNHTCAINADRTVSCWGRNLWGQLGTGNTTDSTVPIRVPGITNAAEVAAGESHTCVRLADQSVSCWGRNASGQLGLGTFSDSWSPRTIANLRAITLALGSNHSCAQRTDETLVCWGDNFYGQLGLNDSGVNRTLPTPVVGLGKTIAIALGRQHSCALSRNRTAWCWGRDTAGELGAGTTGVSTSFPVRVQGLENALAISAGENHTCAMREISTALNVYCWGNNASGQLGTGDRLNRNTAILTNVRSAVQVETGMHHTCARDRDGALFCWGSNVFGSIGDGGDQTFRLRPTLVPGITKVSEFETGIHTCARRENGQNWCWGFNGDGQVGIGTRDHVLTPRKVP